MVKNLAAMQKTRAQSLGGEDPLQEEMATHSSILAWRDPWTAEPGGITKSSPWDLSSGRTEQLTHVKYKNRFLMCMLFCDQLVHLVM